MKNLFSTVSATGIVLCLLVAGCQEKPASNATEAELRGKVTEVTSSANESDIALPTDVEGLQAYLIKMWSDGDKARFDEGLIHYVVEIDDRRAQRDWVNNLWEGTEGVEKNREVAVAVAEALSEAYDIGADTYRAGMGYYVGEGVEQNLPKAIYYWSKPTQDANAVVQRRMANIYLDPNTEPYDADKGSELMHKAAEMGDAEAQEWVAEN